MDINETIQQADLVLSTRTSDDRNPDASDDPRWLAIIAVGEFIDTHPEDIWQFILRWSTKADDDLRDALATCLLEHLLEWHFSDYFPKVEAWALSDPGAAIVFRRSSRLGYADLPGNRERFDALTARVAR